MIGLKPALGLICAFLSTGATTLAAPAPVIQEDTGSNVRLSTRSSSSFNTRQKWQRDEINCIQILNPAPGANYHPGWFVRMNFGASQCQGVTAAGPWTIHLYNNPEIQQGGNIRFDYHEVIADGLNEYKTQYLWNIPADQTIKARNVKKMSDYYVRVETNSHEGIKLVGNAGPFAITADGSMAGSRDLTQYIQDLKRREEQPGQGPNSNLNAEFALRPKPVVVQQPYAAKGGDGTPISFKDESGQATTPEAPSVPNGVFASPEAPKVPVTPEVPSTPELPPVEPEVLSTPELPPVELEVPSTPELPPAEPEVFATPGVNPIADPSTAVSTLFQNAESEIHNPPPPFTDVTDVTSEPDAPKPHNVFPEPEDDGTPAVVTPISHGSLIPNALLVGGSVLAGAAGVGYLGALGFGYLGSAVGAVLGGIVGGLAAVLSLVGVPV
ncbi:hypothetical protein EMPS_06875 [Entomortierella parvispora]|uniref:Uncharacterized protein n=1 Tax=Entomortierella parvispora TaxID=205924 RepID=A0A9P3HD91_9FUNG|nr:hypothetical protein EMPS_06875 [Entomortierella parvispora]